MRIIATSPQRHTLAFMTLLVIARFGLGTFFATASDITVESVASAINNERSSRNIATLNYNAKLAAAADYKAHDMVSRSYFSHTDPDGHYIWDKIVEQGYTPYSILGENLAIDFSSTEGLVSAWVASPTHRANILNQNFADQGVGVAFGNANTGQYFSSIANTFGAQPPQKQAAAQKTPEPKATAPKPQSPSTPVSEQKSEKIPAGKTEQAAIPLQIAQDSLETRQNIADEKLILNIAITIKGAVKTATAMLNSDQISLQRNNAGSYSGTFTFEKYFDIRPYTLNISAADFSGRTASYNFSLKNITFAPAENPKSLGDIKTKSKQPDLYNVFKYIVIVFGFLFLLFLIQDTFHLNKNKGSLLSLKNSHFVVLLLIISTFAIVNWWS